VSERHTSNGLGAAASAIPVSARHTSGALGAAPTTLPVSERHTSNGLGAAASAIPVSERHTGIASWDEDATILGATSGQRIVRQGSSRCKSKSTAVDKKFAHY
jgi:hypothetical protein